jgi:hypothetical protein
VHRALWVVKTSSTQPVSDPSLFQSQIIVKINQTYLSELTILSLDLGTQVVCVAR